MSWARWWAQPLTPRGLTLVIAVALAVMAAAFAVELATRTEEDIGSSDLRVYESYGREMIKRHVPYRDFALEYPPGALPMFLAPSTHILARGSTDLATWQPMNGDARRYYRVFTSLVVLIAAVMLICTALSLAALRRPARTVVLALGVVALSPVLIGEVFPGRFDVWPAGMTAVALALSVRGCYRLGSAAVGLAAATKIYPALLVPVLVIVVARHRGLREATLTALVAIAAAVGVFLPFAVASFSGTWEALRIQFQSGLQIESLASSLLVAASHLGGKLGALGLPPPSELTNKAIETGIHRSVLAGAGVDATETVMTVLLAVALVLLVVKLASSSADPREDLVRYAAAVIVITLVLGTTLSPQYVIWLIPLVPLVGGRRGAVATVLFAGAALLTRFWFPSGYREYENGLGAGPVTLLLARNLTLLATALVLVWPSRSASDGRERASLRS